MPAARPTVLVVDDDAAVRDALERLIGMAGYEVRTFGSAREFLEDWHDHGPACALLDVRLPDLNGLELHQQIRKRGVYLPVIFMTGYGDIPTSVRAMKAGAFDFLTKPVEAAALLRAIEEALEDEARFRSERIEVEELLRRQRSLTPRERQVMDLVLSGMLNKEIAQELGIAEKTVKVHRSRVMSKMGARRVANLVHFAMLLSEEADRTAAGIEPGPSPVTAARSDPLVPPGAYAAGASRAESGRESQRSDAHADRPSRSGAHQDRHSRARPGTQESDRH